VQIATLCLSPDGGLLLAVDSDGRALLINRRRRVLLHRFSFKGPVAAARFSPDGAYIAAAVGRLLQVRPFNNPMLAMLQLAFAACATRAFCSHRWRHKSMLNLPMRMRSWKCMHA
jgi:periodic tryptophan protein 2